jgi:hypothetical protein
MLGLDYTLGSLLSQAWHQGDSKTTGVHTEQKPVRWQPLLLRFMTRGMREYCRCILETRAYGKHDSRVRIAGPA